MLNFKKQKGSSIYIAILIMIVMLGIGLGLSGTFFAQIDILRGIGESTLAFHAADAGTEHVLFIDASSCITEEPISARVTCIKTAVTALTQPNRTLSNGSYYELTVDAGGEETCPAGSAYCIMSMGIENEARRAIFVTR